MKPIVVVGGGIAGVSAAMALRKHGHPVLVVDAFRRLGGRMTSRSGDGWTVDFGCPYFRSSDPSIMHLLREVGMDVDAIPVQDAIVRLHPDGTTSPRDNAFDARRMAMRHGMDSLFAECQKSLTCLFERAVGAIRWVEEDNVFLLRDRETGRSLRDPVTNDIIEASGVVLATTGTEARRIVESSGVLLPIAPAFSRMAYTKNATAIFRVARVDPGFYATEGAPGDEIEWISFEERKVGGRVRGPWSLMLVRAGAALSEELDSADDDVVLRRLYDGARRIVPALPDADPLEASLKRWRASRPAEGAFLSVPSEGVPTNPPGVPFALAGDYAAGNRAEFAAESGIRAAGLVLRRLLASAAR